MRRVFVNGTFDLLHNGHIGLLNYAKGLGDYLYVAIDSDERVRKKKGIGRPIFNQEDRKLFLINLKAVDSVSIFYSDSELENTIKEYDPDVIVIGDDWKGKKIIGSEFFKQVHFYERVNSTTKIIQDIINRGQLH